MSLKGQALRDLVVERLVVAADEIFALFERTFAEYEEEFLRKNLQQPRVQHKEDNRNQQPQEDQDDHFLFPPVPVKTEDEDTNNPSFLHQPPPNPSSAPETRAEAVIRAEAAGEEEPGCSVDLRADHVQEDQPFSCSDSDESDEGWGTTSEISSQCDGQGSNEDPMKDTGDGNIPALYKSLFFPEMGGKKAKRSDSDARKPFSCPVCTKAFESEELLDKHVVIHNNQSPIRCPICNKPCRNNSSFKKHLNIHTEERPFRCSVCMKGFNQKCNLKRHMQTHTEEKSFSCPECGLRLKQQHNLLRHISAVHRGEKPYSCPVCDKAFAQKTVFIIHMRTHTGEKPFSCAVCKKRFRDKCHLKRHIKTHGDQAGAQDELHDSI
ncbi:hypothetical protein NQD34_000751 [Periophthalmus magnuspinnatus]|uniref:zinc finger protein 786-like n=1 Tax=Periophthalmus magnuspinnatus TaxID=409849 RepID=UPI0022C69983|nr:zinc finger protein 786-like [Periophthalmus magnuspinnatus]KAJ0033644.1 hypothetical protein NQD34_000751 [Periophthalmus magnuspinnatus]